MFLITLLVTLLVIAVVIWVVGLIIDMLALPPQVKTIAMVIIGLIGLFYILSLFGVVAPIATFPR